MLICHKHNTYYFENGACPNCVFFEELKKLNDFVKANESEVTEAKEATDFKRMLWLCKEDIASMCREEIEGVKKEIEIPKKQVGAIDKFKVIGSDLKPKQERFQQYIRFELREGKQGEPFSLYDNSRINKWVCDIGSKEDACRILDALNSLDASKNE